MQAEFVGLDWGTSKLQAYAFDKAGNLLAFQKLAMGVGKASKVELENAVVRLAREWRPTKWYASGMIGSDLGWKQVPYLDCPADLYKVAGYLEGVRIAEQTIFLVPGLKCQSMFQLPDVMRGEELEVFGTLIHNTDLEPDFLVCLPGTHTKWVICKGQQICTFSTAMSSELYDCLSQNSVLHSLLNANVEPDESFLQGVEHGANSGKGLTRLLFNIRAKALVQNYSEKQCSAYCRGVLIGHEIADISSQVSLNLIIVVGNQALSQLYSMALQHLNFQVKTTSSKDVLTSGYKALHLFHEEIHA